MKYMNVYDYPLYYEIAFSYQEVKKQIDFFEKVGERFCSGSIRRFLDIGCGPGIQLREIARRGYDAVGLDSNPKMLEYLKKKASEEGLKIETLQADMRDFICGKRCDFAFNLSGSLAVASNQEFLTHLKCVADSLVQGGVYLLENVELELKSYGRQEWTMERDGIKVKTVFEMRMIDPMRQISEGKLILEVHDHGEVKELVNVEETKAFSPQEFKSLVDLSGRFNFLGFYERLSLEPLREIKGDNIVLIQKNTCTYKE